MSDTVVVAIIAGAFSTVTGAIGLAGIWLTKRDVKVVRTENTRQHRTAQEERESSLAELQRAHEKILGKVEIVHEDVRTVVGSVAVIHDQLVTHVNDIKAHGDSTWKTVTPQELHLP